MKKIIILFIIAIFLMPAASVSAQGVSTGISISNGELRSFYLAVGDYYRVPESRVVYMKQHYHVHDEELPVVFFLASQARVDPQVIIDLRYRQRMSWLNRREARARLHDRADDGRVCVQPEELPRALDPARDRTGKPGVRFRRCRAAAREATSRRSGPDR